MYSQKAGYDLLYINTINDIDEALNNSKLYDQRIDFLQDCLEIFDLNDDDKNGENYTLLNCKNGISEALSDLGKYEESDEYYKKLFIEFTDNGYVLANYILTLETRGQKEKAYQIIEDNVNTNTKICKNNEMLFERAREMYEDLGNLKLASVYANKANKC